MRADPLVSAQVLQLERCRDNSMIKGGDLNVGYSRECARSALVLCNRLFWQNFFFLLAVLLAAGTLFSGQGADLLQLAHKPHFPHRLLSLYAPLTFGGILIAMGSFVTTAIGAKGVYTAGRAGKFQTTASVIALIVVPVGLGSSTRLDCLLALRIH